MPRQFFGRVIDALRAEAVIGFLGYRHSIGKYRCLSKGIFQRQVELARLLLHIQLDDPLIRWKLEHRIAGIFETI